MQDVRGEMACSYKEQGFLLPGPEAVVADRKMANSGLEEMAHQLVSGPNVRIVRSAVMLGNKDEVDERPV
jgi:hypothetical protein